MGCENSKSQSTVSTGTRGQTDAWQAGPTSSSKYNQEKGHTGGGTFNQDSHPDPEASDVVPFSNADQESSDDEAEDAKYWSRQKSTGGGGGAGEGAAWRTGSHLPLSSLQSSSPFVPEEENGGSITNTTPSSRPSFARKSLISSGALLPSAASPARGAVNRQSSTQPQAIAYHTDEIELFEVTDDPDRPAPCHTTTTTTTTGAQAPNSAVEGNQPSSLVEGTSTSGKGENNKSLSNKVRQSGGELVPGFARQSSRLTKLLVSDVEDL